MDICFISLGQIPRVELLGYWVGACLSVKNGGLFPRVASSLVLSGMCVSCFTLLPTAGFSVFVVLATLVGMQWNGSVVLISIPNGLL